MISNKLVNFSYIYYKLTTIEQIFLVGLYVYLNSFITRAILNRKIHYIIKILLVLLVWIMPYLGYLIVTFVLIITDKDSKGKVKNIFKFIAVILIYLIFIFIYYSNR